MASPNFPIRRISIHATDTYEGMELSMAHLRAMHVARGWSTVGYHYLIHLDGSIQLTPRPVTTIPAAVKGFNQGMIAVAYVGGKGRDGSHKDTRTPAQKKALGHLVALLAHKYGVAASNIIGHRDLDFVDKNKDGKGEPDEWLKVCPCFEVSKERDAWLKG
jgi:N-acetylmuramoyl-L-alanine amidase